MRILSILRGLLSDEASERQKIRVLARFVTLQLLFVFRNKYAFRWINNIKLYASKHRTSSTECYYYKYYDRKEMILLQKILMAGDVFADVGSNIGSYALLAASEGAFSYAIEPSPDTYELLNENISLNISLKERIKPVMVAVGRKEETVHFSVNLDSTNHVLKAEECIDAIEVEMTKIDTLFDERVPVAMKMDIEGLELEALHGAEKVLSSGKLLLIIIETFDTYVELKQYLKQFGYYEYDYDIQSNKLSVTDQKSGNNAIFISDIEEVRKRIRTNEAKL